MYHISSNISISKVSKTLLFLFIFFFWAQGLFFFTFTCSQVVLIIGQDGVVPAV